MNNKIIISLLVLGILGIGALVYFNLQGNIQNNSTNEFISDLGAQKLAQGYLALILDGDEWKPVGEEGLVKNHGIGHPDSPCSDFFRPLILQFPEDTNPLPSNAALNNGGADWFDFPIQVPVPASGRPELPSTFPSLPPDGLFSQPFFTSFNCQLDSYITQELSGNLNITIYNADNTVYQPEFAIPVEVNVFAAQDYPADPSVLLDGFESATPEEDAWNLIVFP
jgi:hypothetical protein